MNKTKIMIVEDEYIICEEMIGMVESLGYEVTATTDSAEKVIAKAEEVKPDLILMDIRLNGEMDGIEAAEEIRNRFSIPVIFSTAYLDKERIERAKITMPFGYVLKPIQERDLKVTIEMALYISKVDIERKLAEQALKESEERFWNLFNNMSSGCGVWKTTNGNEFTLVDLNISGEKMDNVKKEEIFGKNIVELFPDPDRKFNVSEYFKRVWKTGKPERLPILQFNISDRDVWRENYIYKLPTGEIVVIFDDITEHKQIEAALHKRETLLTAFINALPDISFIFDEDGKYIEVLASQKHLLIAQPDEMLGKTVYDTLPKRIANKIHRKIMDTIKSNKPQVLEYKLVVPAGETWFEGRSASMKKKIDSKNLVVWLTHDITEQKQVEEALKESELNLKTILENAPDHLMVLDLNGNINYVNCTSYSERKGTIGISIFDLLPEKSKDIQKKNIELVLKTGKKQRYEIEYQTLEGQYKTFESHIGPVKVEEKIIGFVLISRDITDR